MKRLLGGLLALSILLTGCGGAEEGEEPERPRRLMVVAAFYPLQFIAEEVSGGKVEVTGLAAAGAEPHDLELTPGQVEEVGAADVLIYLGGGFQPAVEALVPEFTGTVIDGLEVAGQAGSGDPHVWLDPVLMEQIAKEVGVTLGRLDRRNLATYVEGSEAMVEALQVLDDSYQNGLTLCARRELVTSHEAFGHLARRYNLEQIGIAGVDPEQEPSARRLQEVAELVRQRGITTIFSEELLPAEIAKTVAREAGVDAAELNPIETRPDSGDYLSEMRSNLDALRKALGCR